MSEEIVCTEGEPVVVGLLEGQEMLPDTEHVHHAELAKWNDRIEAAHSAASVQNSNPPCSTDGAGIPPAVDNVLVNDEVPGALGSGLEPPVTDNLAAVSVDCASCVHFEPGYDTCTNSDAHAVQNEASIHNGKWVWPHNYDPACLVSCDSHTPKESTDNPSVDFSIHQEGPIPTF